MDGYWGSDSSQHVNFIGVDGDVHELDIAPGAGWVDNNLYGPNALYQQMFLTPTLLQQGVICCGVG
jgi:hypothetical protein